MARVTQAEFESFVAQLEQGDPSSSETLYVITKNIIYGYVCKWCWQDWALKGGEHEEDLFNDIFIKVLCFCVPSFFKRKDSDGEINRNLVEFEKWLYTVALREKIAFSNRRRRELKHLSFTPDDGTLTDDDVDVYVDERAEQIELLSDAFEMVLDFDVSIYKTLTWLAQGLMMLEYGISKSQATSKLVETFEQKTLYDMRDAVFAAAERYSWLVLSDKNRERINTALKEPFDGERCYGEVKYSEFFMKKGGKYSVSDWLNRINSKIKQEIEDETFNS